MAVHCSVCATRLYDATENEGSFQVAGTFTGWDGDDEKAYGRGPRIQHTCASCAGVLREAVTKAANEIVERHRPAIEVLRAEVKAARERQAKFERDKAQFEREWAEKQRAGEER
jgi:hypothetical protein